MAFNSKYAHLIEGGRYICFVDKTLTMDPLYLKRYGTPDYGDAKYNRVFNQGKSRVMLSIKEMLDYSIRGVFAEVPDQKDLLEIYNLLTGYLNEWAERLGFAGNYRVSKYKDLIDACEVFNEYIYDNIDSDVLKKEGNEAPGKYGPMSFQSMLEQSKITRFDTDKPSYKDSNGSIRELVKNRMRIEKSLIRK